MYIKILILGLSILVTLKFIRDLYEDKEVGGFLLITVKGLWSMFFLLYCLYEGMTHIDDYSWIFEYTIIPVYLIMQFSLCILISFFVIYFVAIIKITYTEAIKKNYLLDGLKKIYSLLIYIIIECGLIKYFNKLISFANDFFNPISGIKVIYSRFIKIILTISYLIAGIIVLSPVSNYLYNEISKND